MKQREREENVHRKREKETIKFFFNDKHIKKFRKQNEIDKMKINVGNHNSARSFSNWYLQMNRKCLSISNETLAFGMMCLRMP